MSRYEPEPIRRAVAVPILQRSRSKMAKQAANASSACPPCMGNCDQGDACPAWSSELDRTADVRGMEMLGGLIVLAIVAGALAWHLIAQVLA